MRFTRGLFLGAALGMSAAMMMNNKTKHSSSVKKTHGITAETSTQADDYIVNDII